MEQIRASTTDKKLDIYLGNRRECKKGGNPLSEALIGPEA